MRPTPPPPQAEKKTETELLLALLEEIRLLRIGFERNSLLEHRSTLTLARIHRQEEAVQQLTGELRGVNEEIRQLTENTRYDEDQEDIKEIEDQINESTDPADRLELTHEQSRLKRRLDRQKKSDLETLERKRDQQGKLGERLQLAQAQLNDLNMQLDTFLRELDVRVSQIGAAPAPNSARQRH